MPLRVQCPNGCVMRVPANRAGMSARCPGCKSVVVIPFPPVEHQQDDLLTAVIASSGRSTSESPTESETPAPSPAPAPSKMRDGETHGAADLKKDASLPALPKQAEDGKLSSKKTERRKKPSSDPKPSKKKRKRKPKSKPPLVVPEPETLIPADAAVRKPKRSSAPEEKPRELVKPPESKPILPEPDLPSPTTQLPEVAEPIVVASSARRESTNRESDFDKVDTSALEPLQSKVGREKLDVVLPQFDTKEPIHDLPLVATSAEPSIPSVDFQITLESDSRSNSISTNSQNEPLGVSALEVRTKRANADRITLTRFFAALLVFVGLVNFAPAIYCWYTWSQNDIDFMLPRWIYLQIFVAVLHLIYAVLLLQVPDWSTLRSIAIVMLVFAFIFGVFSMGLLTMGSNGLLAQFLQVPGSLGRQACIWCVAMLCLATLASYLAGRESNAWQRTDKLLAEILANKESA